MRHQLSKDSTVFAAAILITAFVLSFAFRQPAVITKAVETDYSQLTNNQLLKLPLTEPVCEVLLTRPDLQTTTLVAAFRRLAAITDVSLDETFVSRLHQLQPDSQISALRNLSFLIPHVVEKLPDDREHMRDRLWQAAQSGGNAAIRKVAFACVISMDGKTHDVFEAKKEAQQSELLQSLCLVNPNSVAESLYDRLRPLIVLDTEPGVDNPLQQTAIDTVMQMAHAHAALAGDLIQLLRDREGSALIASRLAKLPVDVLPENQLGFVASQFIAQLAEQHAGTKSDDFQLLAQRCLEIGAQLSSEKRMRIEKRIAELTAGKSLGNE